MTNFVTGDSPVCDEILEAFGLNELQGLVRLSLDIAAGEVVTVSLQKLVTSDELKRLAGVLGSKNLSLAGANNVRINAKLIEEAPTADPAIELRELASLLRLSTPSAA